MRRIAIVGCGRIVKKHIEALKEVENVKLKAVCDCIYERAAYYESPQ